MIDGTILLGQIMRGMECCREMDLCAGAIGRLDIPIWQKDPRYMDHVNYPEEKIWHEMLGRPYRVWKTG